MPPFLEVERDVTGQPQFSAYTVSLKEHVTGEPTSMHLQQLLQDAPKLKRTVASEVGGGEGGDDEASRTPDASIVKSDIVEATDESSTEKFPASGGERR